MFNAKYVLTYSENTDAGDPTSLVSTKFFCKKENAQSAMVAAFKATDDIMHYTGRESDDEHYISQTEDSIYVCDGMDSMSWAISEIKAEDAEMPLEEPMSLAEAQKMQSADGEVHGLVTASLSELVGSDIDEVDDILVGRLVDGGIPYLSDLKLALVEAIPGSPQEAVIKVTGQFDCADGDWD